MDKKTIYAVEDDEGIREVYEGAFEGVYDLKELCKQKQKSDVMPDLLLLLESETEMNLK